MSVQQVCSQKKNKKTTDVLLLSSAELGWRTRENNPKNVGVVFTRKQRFKIHPTGFKCINQRHTQHEASVVSLSNIRLSPGIMTRCFFDNFFLIEKEGIPRHFSESIFPGLSRNFLHHCFPLLVRVALPRLSLTHHLHFIACLPFFFHGAYIGMSCAAIDSRPTENEQSLNFSSQPTVFSGC